MIVSPYTKDFKDDISGLLVVRFDGDDISYDFALSKDQIEEIIAILESALDEFEDLSTD